MSQIQVLTSKITQVCQDIHDIKLRQLLVTQSDREPNVITNNILTNHNDHKDTWGSSRSKPETPDKHEGCGVDGNCQEVGLVAFMFFFELLFPYVSSQFPSMFPLLTYSQIILFLIC